MIVEAKINDALKISQILKKSREESMPYLPILHTPAEDLEFIKNIVFKECRVLSYQESSEIKGFIAFTDKWIEHLYLLPSIQRQGIGKALLDEAKAYSKSLKLWAFKKNKAARNFYEKNGFIGIKKTDGSSNEEKEPDILYQWKS